eukprot:5863785-Pyramimonas_sp.AAC.1
MACLASNAKRCNAMQRSERHGLAMQRKAGHCNALRGNVTARHSNANLCKQRDKAMPCNATHHITK